MALPLNDAINLAIADVAGKNQINDKLLRFFQANGATSNDLNDAEFQFLVARGMSSTSELNDMWFRFLTLLGFAGSLNDMKRLFWEFGAAIPSLGISFSDAGAGAVNLTPWTGSPAPTFTRATVANTHLPQTAFLPTGERVSVDFNFMNQSLADAIGNAAITFTRAGATATRVNASGLIEGMGADTPRYDYDPVTKVLKGLLIEEARTNLSLRSADFANAWWVAFAGSVVANQAIAPDGTLSADKWIEDTSLNVHLIRDQVAWVGASTYTFSVYAKAAERTKLILGVSGAVESTGAGANASFDLVTGVTSGAVNCTSTIEPAANGFYRCSITFLTTAVPAAIGAFIYLGNSAGLSSYAGDGASGVYLWGAQSELGAVTSSYIPTVAASVTRNADTVSVAALGTWFNAVEGSLFSEYILKNTNNTTHTIAAFSDGTNNNYISNDSFGAADQFNVVTGGATQASIGGAIAANVVNRQAGAYKLNDFAESTNGAAVNTDVAGTLPAVTGLRLGSHGTGGEMLNGHLRRFLYIPQRVSNANLQTLSGSSPARVSGVVLKQVANNVPRAYYSAAGVYLGYLAEGQRTNLALQSETLDNATWIKTRSSVVANSMVAPDGNVTADKVVEDNTAGNTHFVQQSFAKAAAATQYTVSLWVKAAGRTWFAIQGNDTINAATAYFNLATGVVGSTSANGAYAANGSSITAYPNGWYRCTFTYTTPATANDNLLLFLATADGTVAYNGDGTSAIYMWGVQKEAAFASTYIATVGATATRNADVLTYPTAGWINAATGTMVAQHNNQGGAAYLGTFPCVWGMSNVADINNWIVSNLDPTPTENFRVDTATVTQATMANTVLVTGNNKYAAAWAANDYASCLNGGAVQTDAAGSIPAVATLNIGGRGFDGGQPFYGPIAAIRYFPSRIANANLQGLTA